MAVTWADTYSLAIFATFISAMFIGLAYALGQLMSNPRFNVWAKTELYQVIVSVALVFISLFLVGIIGLDTEAEFSIKAGAIAGLASDEAEYSKPSISDSDSVFKTSEKYLKNLAFFAHRSVRGSRAMIAATDAYSKYMRTPCTPALLLCLMGVNGVNVRPISGAAAFMQGANVLLYTSTAAYLSLLAQIFFLKFIQHGDGLLKMYLPLAIVLRSLPFMRQLGGGLLAICFALFILYPGLLFIESAFWNPYDWIGGTTDSEGTWKTVESFLPVESDNTPLAYGDLFMSGGDWSFLGDNTTESTMSVYDDITRMTSASFLCSTFLFTFNMIAVSAAAVMFARLLGAEVDLSRLVQIV